MKSGMNQKIMVRRTPQEREELIQIGVNILRDNPDISHRQLFVQTQQLLLDESRRQTPGCFKAYRWIKDEALKRLNAPEIEPSTESIQVVLAPEALPVDAGGERDRPGVLEGPASQEGGLRGVRDLVVGLIDQVFAEFQKREDSVTTLQKTFISFQDNFFGFLERMDSLKNEISSIFRFLDRMDSLQNEVSSISRDLYGPPVSLPAPVNPEPVPTSVKPEPVPVKPEPVSKKQVKIRIGLIGLKNSQFNEVRRAVGDSVDLRMFETGKKFDDQAIKNCDWILVSRWNEHSTFYRMCASVGKDRVFRPRNQGVVSYIGAIKKILTSGSPN